MASSASITCSYDEKLELVTCAFFIKLFSEEADTDGCIPMGEVAQSLQETRAAILQYVHDDGNFYSKRSYFFNFGKAAEHYFTNAPMALQPQSMRSFVALINRFVYLKTKEYGSVKIDDVLGYCRANSIVLDALHANVTRSCGDLAKFLRPFSFLFTLGFNDSMIKSHRDIPLETEIQEFSQLAGDYFQNPAGRNWQIHDMMDKDTIDIGSVEKVSSSVDSLHIHANGSGEGLALYQGSVDSMNVSSPWSGFQALRSTFSPVESVHSSSPGSLAANGYGMLQGCPRCGHVKPETNNAQTQTAKCLEDFMRELPLRQLRK